MKRHVVLLGPPGSGKGTVAHQLEDHFHLEHISTGDWFRREIAADTELGRKVRAYMERGELVPDELVVGLVEHFMTDGLIEHGYIFDGFPRTESQARALDRCCQQKRAPIEAALCLDCPEDLIVQRIIGRRVCPKCNLVFHLKNHPPQVAGKCDGCGSDLVHRADDTEEVVRKRLHEYRKASAPVVEYYRKTNRLVTLNSESEADVFHFASAFLEEG